MFHINFAYNFTNSSSHVLDDLGVHFNYKTKANNNNVSSLCPFVEMTVSRLGDDDMITPSKKLSRVRLLLCSMWLKSFMFIEIVVLCSLRVVYRQMRTGAVRTDVFTRQDVKIWGCQILFSGIHSTIVICIKKALRVRWDSLDDYKFTMVAAWRWILLTVVWWKLTWNYFRVHAVALPNTSRANRWQSKTSELNQLLIVKFIK